MECGSSHKVYQYKGTGKYYCCKHREQLYKHGKIMDEVYKKRKEEMVCSVCGIKGHEIINGKRYCNRHAMQIRRNGKILKETVLDPNEIKIYKDESYAEIVLKDKDLKVVALSKVDLEDLDFVKKYKWGYSPDGYMTTRINHGTRRYHRLITDAPKDKVVDHVNGDSLDNRKNNLNVTTQSINSRNRHDKATTSSGHKGIYKHRNKWTVRIGGFFVCVFDTMEEAVIERKKMEFKLNYNYRREGHQND